MTIETRDNLFLRDDTFFGVCEALGEDLHIPSNLLRLGMAPLLIWNPVATVLGYFGVGIVIASIRLAFPNRRRVKIQPVKVQAIAQTEAVVEETVLAKAA